MKKLSKLICFVLVAYCVAVFFAACTEDPYADYVATGLQPKTNDVGYSEDVYVKWMTDTQLTLLTTYSEYQDYDVDLGYSKGYFENNSLLIFLRTGCSTDNLQFVEVLEKEGKLYPVVEINPYGPNDPSTDDIILYVFYVEISSGVNYSVGEIITKTRDRKVMQ